MLKPIQKFDINQFVSESNQIKNIPINKLMPYHNHQFKLYSGERLEDMVESIRQNGILNPILVQPIGNNKYEILSGHNRVEGARIVGLNNIPAIIKENLSEDEAEMYVIETNLIQRGFNELLISEQAHVLKIQHSKMFSQGKRNDIIRELEFLEHKTTSDAMRPKLNENECKITSDAMRPKLNENEYKTTSDAMRPKLNENEYKTTSDAMRPKLNENEYKTTSDAMRPKLTRDTLAENYGLGTTSVSYLIRINYLIPTFKDMVDNKTLSLRAGVDLSFISEDAQKMVYEVISNHDKKIDMKLSKAIRNIFNTNEDVTMETLESLIIGQKKSTKDKPIKILLNRNVYSKYFDEKTSIDEITDTIQKALDMYFKSLN